MQEYFLGPYYSSSIHSINPNINKQEHPRRLCIHINSGPSIAATDIKNSKMASVLRFQEMTPPLSDRGDCEDSTGAMLKDNFLPEVFYPSPAPSFSPDMGHSDNSTYDTEEDCMFLQPTASQIFPATTSLQQTSMYPDIMPFPSLEQDAWSTYSSYPSNVSMYPFPSEEQSTMFPTYMAQVPSTIIPPMPQEITGGSFNFNEPIARPQAPNDYLRSYSTSSLRHRSPGAPSVASFDDASSRSASPVGDSERSRRASLLPQRSSSSSLHAYGIPIRSADSSSVQAWRCAFPNCTSRAVFTRGCDLRKHYNRHSKNLFCRVDGCPQSEAACVRVAQEQAIQAGADASNPSKLAVSGGFSSKKDRARHEAKHAPSIRCEFPDCGRVFSRMDNMKDHCRRIHQKGQPQQAQHTSRRKSSEA